MVTWKLSQWFPFSKYRYKLFLLLKQTRDYRTKFSSVYFRNHSTHHTGTWILHIRLYMRTVGWILQHTLHHCGMHLHCNPLKIESLNMIIECIFVLLCSIPVELWTWRGPSCESRGWYLYGSKFFGSKRLI